MACGAPQPDSFALAITAGLTIQSFRAFLPPDTTSSAASLFPRCTCLHKHRHSQRRPHGVPRSGFTYGTLILRPLLLCCPHAHVYVRGQYIVPYIWERRFIASCVRERFPRVGHACSARKQVGRPVGPIRSTTYTRPLAFACGCPG